ncbi:MAG: FAD synthase [Euryarchaeota archaeon]|nr:FAD synthase [Euryarchaeota archaeon]MBT86406.1 FAD synthase [Euryarchaeota archaeon]DAC46682.1 MAG TPA: FAD synthase [Candidatus Poseidoniales archaeon]HII33933.1 FAD synthase [Candidatus Thalassarchaeaceae archaeon]|tara:strand:+ start:288 stop:746 length:459 start_codon:yes stop_codon:yes gene_type:complete
MVKVMAVGVFDLLHAGHLHYLEQAKSLGDELVVVVAHDDTVRSQKHEPVTSQDLRCRMVNGLKPVDKAIIGNSPGTPIFDILNVVKPDIIALGYDQKHSIDSIRIGLDKHGFSGVGLTRVEGLSDDLDGTRKIIARILDLWPNSEGGPYEED